MTGAAGAAQDDPARVGPSTTAGGDAATATPSLAEVQGRRIKKSPHIEVYRDAWFDFTDAPYYPLISEYRWRFRAANGRIVAQSSEGYRRIRDVVRSIEVDHPGFEVQELVNGWHLVLRLDWIAPAIFINPEIKGAAPRVPIRVPEGVSLASRRRP